jgi:hypothetical protein
MPRKNLPGCYTQAWDHASIVRYRNQAIPSWRVDKITVLLVAPVPQTLQFEVASIRPGRSDGIREFQIQGERLVISGMSVKDLVRRAYGNLGSIPPGGNVPCIHRACRGRRRIP